MSTTLKFDELLALLVNRGVPLCEVRPRMQSTTEVTADLDLLVPINGFKRLPEALYSICMHAGLSFVIRRFSPINLKLYVLPALPGSRLVLDFWSEIQVRDPRDRLPCWQGFSWSDLEAHMGTRNTSLELTPEVGGMVYLTHLYTKRKSLESSAVQERLEIYRASLSERGLLTNLTSKNLEPTCIHALEILADRGIYRRRMPLTSYITSGIRARLVRLFTPMHLPKFGVLLGVDGAGKTTLLNRTVTNHDLPIHRIHFRTLYRGAFFYKLLMLPRRGKVVDQRERRNHDASFLLIFNILARFRLRESLRLAKDCDRVPILDRYFYDFMLHDMTSGRAQQPRLAWWAPARRFLAPRPTFAIQVWVGFEVSASRKNELTITQWSVYNKHIRTSLLRSLPKLLCVINNDGEIDGASHVLADFFIYHVCPEVG